MIESSRGVRRQFPAFSTAIRLCFFLLIALMSAMFASAQALNPGGPVDFGDIAVGSSAQNVTMTFSANVPTLIQSGSVTTEGAQGKDFSLVSDTCIGALFPPQSCSITIGFKALQIGLRRGALLITDGTGTVVNRVFIFGIGIGPQISFQPVTVTTQNSVAPLTPTTFQPSSLVYDGDGNLYFNDIANSRILKQALNGTFSVFANVATEAQSSLAISGDGTIYISQPSLGTVLQIRQGGLPAAMTTPGVTLGKPTGVTVDGLGYVYIADAQSNTIVRVADDGSSTYTLATPGLTPGLSNPGALAADLSYLYIADAGNDRIVQISLTSGAASVFNGNAPASAPSGLAVEPSGNVIESTVQGLYILSPGGTTTPLTLPATPALTNPLGLALKTNGDLIGTDPTAGLFTVVRSSSQLTFATPTDAGSFDATDGYLPLTVEDSGNVPLQLGGTDPSIDNGDFAVGPSSVCPSSPPGGSIAVGFICTYAIGFTPTAAGPITGTLNFSGSGASGNVTLNGTGIAVVTGLQLIASPDRTQLGVPVSYTLNVIETGGGLATTFVGTVQFTSTDATGIFLSGTSYAFTAADAGSHTFAAPVGIQFNTFGTFTLHAVTGVFNATSNPVVVQNPSQTSFTSSVNPSALNQSTTLTATVTGTTGLAVPTGTVTFLDGSTVLGIGTLNGSGVATLDASFTTSGAHSLTAVYSGDTDYSTSTSSLVIQTVTQDTQPVSLTSSINPSVPNQSTTLTATIAGATGIAVPSGTVTFLDGSTVLGTATVNGGVATFAASFVTLGAHSVTAVYSGDTDYTTATSPVLIQNVLQNTPLVGLTSSINPSVPNQSTTLTATVAPSTGLSDPTGTVTFKDGGTTLGTATLNNGVATFAASFAVVGAHSLTAVYSGDSDYLTATSPVLIQNVLQNTPQVGLTSSVNPSAPFQSTTLTATVPRLTGLPLPTGTVTFMDGGTALGTATLNNGVATFGSSFVTLGAHPLTAVYSGNTEYAGATSPVLMQTVEDFSIAVSSGSSSSLTVNPGDTASYKFTITPVGAATYPNQINLAVVGIPDGAVASFTPANVAAGSGATDVTLKITGITNQAHSQAVKTATLLPHTGERLFPLGLALLALPVVMLRRRRKLTTLLLWMLICFSTAGLSGCLTNANDGYFDPGTPHLYTLTVTATSGSITHASVVTLDVP